MLSANVFLFGVINLCVLLNTPSHSIDIARQYRISKPYREKVRREVMRTGHCCPPFDRIKEVSGVLDDEGIVKGFTTVRIVRTVYFGQQRKVANTFTGKKDQMRVKGRFLASHALI